MEQCWAYTPLNNSHPKRGRHGIRDEETQLEEELVRAHEGPCHPRGQESADPRLREEGHGMAASQAQAVQHRLQEDHVQLVRPVQVTRAKGGNHMCSNPDTYEFRLSLDLPQQSAVPTDTFSALREVHEYSAENGPRFHTAAEMFDEIF